MGFDIFGFIASLGFKKEFVVPLGTFFMIAYLVWELRLGKILNNLKDKSISPITKAIIEIQTIFGTMDKKIQYFLTEKSESPLSPSEYGLQLFTESGLKEILENKQTILFGKLKTKLSHLKVVTSYDVQEQSIDLFTKDLLHDPLLAEVKTYVFHKGIDIIAILRVASFILRDKYLKEHSEIK